MRNVFLDKVVYFQSAHIVGFRGQVKATILNALTQHNLSTLLLSLLKLSLCEKTKSSSLRINPVMLCMCVNARLCVD